MVQNKTIRHTEYMIKISVFVTAVVDPSHFLM